jgi:hypothetical protein
LTGAVHAQISVTRDAAKNIVVEVEWLKDGQEGDVIVSQLETVTVGTDEENELITSCVIQPIEGAASPVLPVGKKKKREAKSVKTFRAAFTEALDVGGKTIRVRGDGPRVRAVDVSQVKKQFELRWATGESDPDKRAEAQRKAFDRLLKTLPAEFVTGVQDGIEWLWML